jgi:hypothetical protein
VRDGVLTAEVIAATDAKAARELFALQSGAERAQGILTAMQAAAVDGRTEAQRTYAAKAVRQMREALEQLDAITDPAGRRAADGIVWHMVNAMQFVAWSDVKVVQREIVIGAKSARGADSANARRSAESKSVAAVWQTRAASVWAEHPKLPAWKVAELIAQPGEKPNTIRRAIKRPR